MKLIVFLALALAMMACLIKAQSVTEVALDAVPHSRYRCEHSACNDLCIAVKRLGGYCVLGFCTCR